MRREKTNRKMKHVIKWTVHPHRQDKRTGVITPVPLTPYGKYTMNEIENMWKKGGNIDEERKPTEDQ